jgi:hypothetical protein
MTDLAAGQAANKALVLKALTELNVDGVTATHPAADEARACVRNRPRRCRLADQAARWQLPEHSTFRAFSQH